jgi:hypothetical protein
MADRRVYLAARVRPLNPREISMGAKRLYIPHVHSHRTACQPTLRVANSAPPPLSPCLLFAASSFLWLHLCFSSRHSGSPCTSPGSCVVVDGSCTTLVNPDTGDALSFLLYTLCLCMHACMYAPACKRTCGYVYGLHQTRWYLHTFMHTHTGDAKAFVLDYSFDSSDSSDRQASP